jgi:hypothetical protein
VLSLEKFTKAILKSIHFDFNELNLAKQIHFSISMQNLKQAWRRYFHFENRKKPALTQAS